MQIMENKTVEAVREALSLEVSNYSDAIKYEVVPSTYNRCNANFTSVMGSPVNVSMVFEVKEEDEVFMIIEDKPLSEEKEYSFDGAHSLMWIELLLAVKNNLGILSPDDIIVTNMSDEIIYVFKGSAHIEPEELISNYDLSSFILNKASNYADDIATNKVDKRELENLKRILEEAKRYVVDLGYTES